jgi:hypothetical protein
VIRQRYSPPAFFRAQIGFDQRTSLPIAAFCLEPSTLADLQIRQFIIDFEGVVSEAEFIKSVCRDALYEYLLNHLNRRCLALIKPLDHAEHGGPALSGKSMRPAIFFEPLDDLSFLNILTSSFLLESQWLFYTSTKLRTL